MSDVHIMQRAGIEDGLTRPPQRRVMYNTTAVSAGQHSADEHVIFIQSARGRALGGRRFARRSLGAGREILISSHRLQVTTDHRRRM